MAYNADRSFRRFCLLSGANYPIKSRRQITNAFESPRQFIRVDRSIGPAVTNTHTANVREWWFMDASRPINRGLGGRIARRPYDKIELYQGSAWWALTRDCVGYIFDFLSTHHDYQPFFKYTKCPDEIFFHSILKSSPFATAIKHEFERASNLDQFFLSNDHGCHYIDWNARGERLPRVLDLADLRKLEKSGALFARKFEDPRSEPLIATLNRVLTR